MQGVTLTVALVGSVLVLLLRPPYALAAYIAGLIWYPDYLRITIGTLDISAGRIVVTVLLLRCLCSDEIRKNFRWSRLDTLVALSMVVYVGVYCLANPLLSMAFENRAGFLMDTWLAYMAARFIVTDKETLTSFMKVTAVVLVALAILGVAESATGRFFFLGLKRFRPWRTPLGDETIVKARWGLGRANGPFSHSIMFGGCFVMFLPLVWALRHHRGYWGKLAYPFSVTAIIGALSSMSSGPWSMLIVTVFCLALEKYKRWAKVVLASFVMLCFVVGAISNRPFYHVLYSYADIVGGDWYQRVKLIDSAIQDFGKWWLAGSGGKDPGWGARYNAPTDTNNEFIKAGIQYGLLGIITLCAVLAEAFRGLIRASRQTENMELKSLYWAMGCTLAGVIVLWQGVSFFGQMPSIFY